MTIEIDFNLDIEEIVKKAPVATKLNEEVKKIVEYFNSDEYRMEEIKEAQEVAGLMPQVIGAEVDLLNYFKRKNGK